MKDKIILLLFLIGLIVLVPQSFGLLSDSKVLESSLTYATVQQELDDVIITHKVKYVFVETLVTAFQGNKKTVVFLSQVGYVESDVSMTDLENGYENFIKKLIKVSPSTSPVDPFGMLFTSAYGFYDTFNEANESREITIAMNTGDGNIIYQMGFNAENFLNHVDKSVNLNESIKTYAEKIVDERSLIIEYEKQIQSFEVKTNISRAYGSLSWYYLFERQFLEAEKAAHRALKYDNRQEWVYTNLALALLFQDKYEEAKKIYLNMKDMPYTNGDDHATYREVFIFDLNELQSFGITHPDTKKIRYLLDE